MQCRPSMKRFGAPMLIIPPAAARGLMFDAHIYRLQDVAEDYASRTSSRAARPLALLWHPCLKSGLISCRRWQLLPREAVRSMLLGMPRSVAAVRAAWSSRDVYSAVAAAASRSRSILRSSTNSQ